jgi:hypothetical protein
MSVAADMDRVGQAPKVDGAKSLALRRQVAAERWATLNEVQRKDLFVLIYADYLRLTDSDYRQAACAKCSSPCAKCGV